MPGMMGLASEGDKNRLEGLMSRLRRAGILHPATLPAEKLAQEVDDALFSAIQVNELNIVRGLCPPAKDTSGKAT